MLCLESVYTNAARCLLWNSACLTAAPGLAALAILSGCAFLDLKQPWPTDVGPGISASYIHDLSINGRPQWLDSRSLLIAAFRIDGRLRTSVRDGLRIWSAGTGVKEYRPELAREYSSSMIGGAHSVVCGNSHVIGYYLRRQLTNEQRPQIIAVVGPFGRESPTDDPRFKYAPGAAHQRDFVISAEDCRPVEVPKTLDGRAVYSLENQKGLIAIQVRVR